MTDHPNATIGLEDAQRIVAPLYDALNQPMKKDVKALLEQACLSEYRSYSTNHESLSREELVEQFRIFGEIIPGLAWRIEEIWTSGDRIFVRGEATGTPAAELFGVKPTGKSFRTMALDFFTVKSGRLSAAYHIENWPAAVEQIR